MQPHPSCTRRPEGWGMEPTDDRVSPANPGTPSAPPPSASPSQHAPGAFPLPTGYKPRFHSPPARAAPVGLPLAPAGHRGPHGRDGPGSHSSKLSLPTWRPVDKSRVSLLASCFLSSRNSSRTFFRLDATNSACSGLSFCFFEILAAESPPSSPPAPSPYPPALA